MKVEIWSDVMCPFCYIGKRRFESGLAMFPQRDDIEITWKSFQLNPNLQTNTGKSINEYLADVKGWSVEEARQMNARVTEMAAGEGLTFDFDKAVITNSFDAHRVIQLAKSHGLGDEMEERLFRAYFTEGLDTSDFDTLVKLAAEAGLDPDETARVLAGKEFTEEVERDLYEARQIGVRGVPYFVFNDRYAVSGAQSGETFLGALQKSWSEWSPQPISNDRLEASGGEVCGPDGDCV
ncbi:MAG: DsbA family oxidoreductase [Chitinophagaceae bacterium]